MRSKPSVNPVKFTIKKKIAEKVGELNDDASSVKSEESLGFTPRKNSAGSSTAVSDKENVTELPVISARSILGLKQDKVQQQEEEEDGGCVMCSS